MKRLTMIVIIIVVLLLLTSSAVGAAYGLAVIGPLNPGNPLFPLQGTAEQFWLSTTNNPERRADYALVLLNRRTNDLAILTGEPAEVTALQYLDQVLDQTLTEIATLTPTSYPPRRSQLVEEIKLIKVEVANLQVAPKDHAGMVEAFSAKIETLDLILQSQAATPLDLLGFNTNVPSEGENAAQQSEGTPIPGLIPFPGDSAAEMHNFFPLEGGHSALDCTNCHRTDQYTGLQQACILCHLLDQPENHFGDACDACHVITAWKPASFDHTLANAIDCQSCHSDDSPVGHYMGQCSACHTTSAWKPASFDHTIAGATDCQTCHSRPAGHYSGQCSACHATSAWRPASFNHSVAGASDCQSCHSRSAGHYNGQCSACHSTNTWSGARIDHSQPGLDCRSCHSGHTTEQCSNCHSYPSWDDAEGEEHEGGDGNDDGDDDDDDD